VSWVEDGYLDIILSDEYLAYERSTMTEMTGTERVRAAVERDRGGRFAPGRVTLCGEPDPNAMRADDPRWPGNLKPDTPKQLRAIRLERLLICSDCIRFRFSPIHLLRRIAGVCDGF
jgi:hypothetical protein